MSGEVYLITDRINGKQYVGICAKVLRNGRMHGTSGRWCGKGLRFPSHCERAIIEGVNCHSFLDQAIAQTGSNMFRVVTIFHDIPTQNLLQVEQGIYDVKQSKHK